MVRNQRRSVKIGDLGVVITGSTPPSKGPDLFGEEYPFITPTDLDYESRTASTERYISEKGRAKFKSRMLPRNAVCFVCIGATIGKLCITAKESLTNQQVNSIIVDEDRYDPRYVYYLLRTETRRIASQAGGAATPIINKSNFSEIDILVFDLPVQRKIASILSVYDDLIENNLRRIEILEEMAQALYREWFVKFRFPGHENVKMVNSELGEIPEGWEIIPLSELVETQYGYTESAKDEPVGPKFLRGTDINKHPYIDWDSVPFCTIDEEKLQRYRLQVGDILVIRMADPGKVALVEEEVEAVFASYLVRLSQLTDKCSPLYLFYFLLSDRYQNYISGASTGTTRKSASAGVLTGIDVIVPGRVVLRQFENVIQPMRRLINNLLKRNGLLRRTRNLLLPRLISGELDVSDLDIEVPENFA